MPLPILINSLLVIDNKYSPQPMSTAPAAAETTSQGMPSPQPARNWPEATVIARGTMTKTVTGKMKDFNCEALEEKPPVIGLTQIYISDAGDIYLKQESPAGNLALYLIAVSKANVSELREGYAP